MTSVCTASAYQTGAKLSSARVITTRKEVKPHEQHARTEGHYHRYRLGMRSHHHAALPSHLGGREHRNAVHLQQLAVGLRDPRHEGGVTHVTHRKEVKPHETPRKLRSGREVRANGRDIPAQQRNLDTGQLRSVLDNE